MAQEQPPATATPRSPRLSLDWWAVITALVLAALLWAGVLPAIPW